MPQLTGQKEGFIRHSIVILHSPTVYGLEGGHHFLGGGAEDLVLVGNLGDVIHYPRPGRRVSWLGAARGPGACDPSPDQW